MKALTNILSHLLMLLLLLAACTEEAAEVDNLMRQEQYVTVRMNIPGMTATATRADADGAIKSVTALAFNSADELLEVETINTVTNTNANNGFNGTFTLTVPNGTTTIHFLANLPDDAKSQLPTEMGGSEVDVMTSLTTGDYQNLCYWGMTTTWDGNTNPLNVTLYRNLAKISIKPSITDTEFNQFEEEDLIIAGLIQPNRSGTLVPYNSGFYTDANGAAPGFLTLPGGNLTPTSKDVTPEGNDGAGYGSSLYAFEHDNPAHWDQGLYVICKIGGAYYYKVALANDNGEPYDIIRNHEYIIYVSDVDDYSHDTNYRADTYDDVINKYPINLEVEVTKEVALTFTTSTTTLNYNTTSKSNLILSVTVPPEVNTLKLSTPGFTVVTFSDTSYNIDENTSQNYLVSNGDGSFTVNHPENDVEHTFSFRLELNDNPQQSSYQISCTATSEDANVTVNASDAVTVSLNQVDDNADVYWQGNVTLDYLDSATKIPIPAEKLTAGTTVTLEYVKGDGTPQIAPQNGGWGEFTNLAYLDISNATTTSFTITDELYAVIQENKSNYAIFGVSETGMILQGKDITLTKITIDQATNVQLSVNPTEASLYYDSDNTQEITVTVPNDINLTELTITPSVDCFTIAPKTGNLTGPENGVYTYAPDGGVSGPVTFTIAPNNYEFTEDLNSTIIFDGTGDDLYVSEAQTVVTLSAMPTVTFSPTEDQTIYLGGDPLTVTMTVPNGGTLTTLSIAAEGFNVTSSSSSGELTDLTNNVYSYTGGTTTFTFTPTSVGSYTISFYDGQGENINVPTEEIAVTVEETEIVSEMSATSGTIDLGSAVSTTLTLTKPTTVTGVNVSITDANGASANSYFSITFSGWTPTLDNGNFEIINSNLATLELIFTVTDNAIPLGEYTITFTSAYDNQAYSTTATITVINSTILWSNNSGQTLSYTPFGFVTDQEKLSTLTEGQTIYIEMTCHHNTDDENKLAVLVNSNWKELPSLADLQNQYQTFSKETTSYSFTLSEADITELTTEGQGIYMVGAEITITRIYVK